MMYLPRVDGTTGHLISLEMVPMPVRRFRLNKASKGDVAWLYETVARESARLDTKVTMLADGNFGIETGRNVSAGR